MKPKHTIGPWHIGMKPGPMIYGPNGEQVADMQADLLPRDERSANAKLIAAAPELLEELSLTADILDTNARLYREKANDSHFAVLRKEYGEFADQLQRRANCIRSAIDKATT